MAPEDRILYEIEKMGLGQRLPVTEVPSPDNILDNAARQGYSRLLTNLSARGFLLLDANGVKKEFLVSAALMSSNPDTVRLLLDRENHNMVRVLTDAMVYSSIDIVLLALEEGIDLSDPDVSLQAFESAAAVVRADVVQLLLSRGANIASARKNDLGVLLNSFVNVGPEPLVQVILDEVRRDGVYWSASRLLDFAVGAGAKPNIVRLILNQGAGNIESDALMSALSVTACRGNCALSNLLLYWTGQSAEEDPVNESMLEAATKGDLPTIEQLVSQGVSTTNAVAHTVLAHAAAGGHEAIVTFFLDSGLNLRDRGNYCALDCALSSGNMSIVSTLLDHGANVNSKAPAGKSLLDSVPLTSTDMVHQLLGAGLTVHEYDPIISHRNVFEVLEARGWRDID